MKEDQKKAMSPSHHKAEDELKTDSIKDMKLDFIKLMCQFAEIPFFFFF